MIAFAPASEADFERLLVLRGEVMRPHLERLGRYHPERSRARFREAFKPETMRLILVDNAFAGCVTFEAKGDHIELGQFYLAPPRQGRGLGGRVLDILLAEADTARLPVRLHVLKLSPAARLYERHGFVRTHEEEWDIFYERPIKDQGP
ncbi:MAG: GNAT family N-acetyltransferase [Alphaproteobacteria bacterium]|nr:GNAT family N-acetyltransferase [Alphaproteobacteria bacterium]